MWRFLFVDISVQVTQALTLMFTQPKKVKMCFCTQKTCSQTYMEFVFTIAQRQKQASDLYSTKVKESVLHPDTEMWLGT